MSNSEPAADLESHLEEALKTMQDLQRRLEAGEHVPEQEIAMLSRMVNSQIETVRTRLEEAVGPFNPYEIQEEMRKQLSPEEYSEWLAAEKERLVLKEELQREEPIRKQLEDEIG